MKQNDDDNNNNNNNNNKTSILTCFRRSPPPLSSTHQYKFIDKCISKFMGKLCNKKPVMLIVLKKRLYLVLTFYGENVSFS